MKKRILAIIMLLATPSYAKKKEKPVLVDPAASVDVIYNGQAIVKIHVNGTIEYAPSYTPDSASRAFWVFVAEHYPLLNDYAALSQENVRLAVLNAVLTEQNTALKSAQSAKPIPQK